MRFDVARFPLQHLPHVVDVVFDGPVRASAEYVEMMPRQVKMLVYEGFKVKCWKLFLSLVVRHHLCRRLIWNCIGESLLIGAETGHLDRMIEFAKLDRGRRGLVGRKCRGWKRKREREREPRDDQRDQGGTSVDVEH